jgi:hypothetical protein
VVWKGGASSRYSEAYFTNTKAYHDELKALQETVQKFCDTVRPYLTQGEPNITIAEARPQLTNSIIDAEIALVKLYDDMVLCFEDNTKELKQTKETKDASIIRSCTQKVKTLRSRFVSDNADTVGQISV